jgi:hypothetical protein
MKHIIRRIKMEFSDNVMFVFESALFALLFSVKNLKKLLISLIFILKLI